MLGGEKAVCCHLIKCIELNSSTDGQRMTIFSIPQRCVKRRGTKLIVSTELDHLVSSVNVC